MEMTEQQGNFPDDEDDKDALEDSDVEIASCIIYGIGAEDEEEIIKTKVMSVSDNDESGDEITIKIESEEAYNMIYDSIEDKFDSNLSPKHELLSNSENEVSKPVDNTTLLVNENSLGNSSDTKEESINKSDLGLAYNPVEENYLTIPKSTKKKTTSKNDSTKNICKTAKKTKIQKVLEICENNRTFNENQSSIFSITDEHEIIKQMVQFKCKNCNILWNPKNNTTALCPWCKKKVIFYCKTCTRMRKHAVVFFQLPQIMKHLFRCHKEAHEIKRNLDNIINTMYDYKCWKCQRSYKLKTHRDNHELKCRIAPNYKCPICQKIVSTKKAIQCHLTKKHKISLEFTDFDDVSFKVETDLFIELKDYMKAFCFACNEEVPVDKNRRSCLKCKTRLIFLCNYEPCMLNGTMFSVMENMIFHLRKIHLQCHICQYCTWPFNSIGELSEHQQNCEVLAQKIFHHSNIVKLSDYECSQCKKSFLKKSGLVMHELHCLGQYKPVKYRCAHCTYRGYKKKSLIKHLKLIHRHLFTGKFMKCPNCDTMWSSVLQFSKHMVTCSGNHNEEISKQEELLRRRRVRVL